MSKSIDERIVQMSFKNDNFQSGVASTMSALDKLKASLDMSAAKSKFGELANAANGVHLDGLASEADKVSDRFGALKTVAVGALLSIGSKVADLALSWGQNAIGSMTQASKAGFDEYELKMGSIQTILANTSKYGTTLDDVTGSLEELNKYADKTIYNFGDMTKNIGLFTNAGIKLEDATTMIKGFSNEAAASGAGAEAAARAATQLSQALSAGTVRAQDWFSITNAGMGNKNMQTGLIDIASAMGQFNESTTDAATASGDFKGSLEKEWLSADVMSGYLQVMAQDNYDLAYAQAKAIGLTDQQADSLAKQAVTANAAATKVRTFSQLMGTLAESAGSGWGKSWELLLGNFEEATEVFTLLNDKIGAYVSASADARNAQLQIWHDTGGYAAAVQSLKNIFTAIERVLDPIKKAFAEVFPPSWGSTLVKITQGFEKFTAGLIISEEASEKLGQVVKIFLMPIKFIIDVIAGAFQVLWSIISMGFGLLGSLIGLITPLISFFVGLIPPIDTAGKKTESFADILSGFIKGGIQPLIDWITRLGTAFSEFLNGDSVTNRVAKIKSTFEGLIKVVQMIYNVLDHGDFTGNPFFEEDSKFVDILFRIREGAIAVTNAIKDFFGNVKSAGTGVAGVLGSAWAYLSKMASDAGPMFSKITDAIGEALSGVGIEHLLGALNAGVLLAVGVAFKKMFDKIKGVFDDASSIFSGFSDALDGVTGVLKGMQTKLKAEALVSIAIAIGILALSLAIMAQIDSDKLMSAAVGMGVAMGSLMAAMKIMGQLTDGSWSDTGKMILVGVALIQMATAVTILANAIKIMGSMSWDELLRGMTGLAVAMGLLVGAAVIVSKFAPQMAKSAVGMILMADAVIIMAGAVFLFGNMPMDVLIQGGIAIATVLGVLVGAAVILSQFAPKMVLAAVGIMAMAAAINMLIVPITAFGLMPLDVLTQGMVIFATALGILVLAALLIANLGPQMALGAVGMMAMAAAINMLVAPITIFGMMDLGTLVQGLIGLAGAMAVLVVAAMLMTGAIVGAGAMIVVAGAVLILAAAINIVAGIPMEAVIGSIIAIVGAMILVGGAAALLGLAAPLILTGAIALGIIGLAMIMMAGATVIFALGLTMLGPALLIATGGLLAFAQVAPMIAAQVPAFLAIGAGLLVFGAGALVAGAGVLVLGAGLVVLGAGLALIGVFGPIGTIALVAFVKALGKMADQMPNLLAMSGTFTVVGAATLVLGAGLLVLGAGALLTAVGLALLVPLGGLIDSSFKKITAAIEKLLPQTENIGALGGNFKALGSAIDKVGAAGSGAAAGMNATSMGFQLMATSSIMAAQGVNVAGQAINAAMAVILASTRSTSTGFAAAMVAMTTSLAAFKMGLASAAPAIAASAQQIGRSVGPGIINEINGSVGGMREAGYNVGRAITDGMANGVRSGQNNVTSAARAVAQNALAASKATLGVHSPSKEFFKVGAWSSEGQALGILAEGDQVSDASTDVAKNAIKALNKAMSKYGQETMLNIDSDPVIKPVLDLAEFNKAKKTMASGYGNPNLSVEGMKAMAFATRNAVQVTADAKANPDDAPQAPIQFIQNNTSPKSLSNEEIYRRTKNQLSVAKGALTTTNAKPS